MMMWKIGAMAAVALAMVVPAQAQLLMYEGCDYAAGESFLGGADWDPTGGKDGGTGWGEAWQGKNGRHPIVGTGLTYTDLPDVGGSAYTPGRNETERKQGQDANDQWMPNNEVWFSMLVDPDEGKGDLSARFYTTYAGSSVPWYYNRGIGFNLDNSGSILQSSLGASRGIAQIVDSTSTNLIVGKIETGDTVGASIATTLTVWGNPVIADGEPTSGGSVVSRNMGAGYESEVGDYLGVKGGSSWGGAIDEIRLGMTFDDVVGAIDALDGDYNDDAFVGQGDLDLVLLNWGDTGGAPEGWVNDQPAAGDLIGQGYLDKVLLNWGEGTAPTSSVPEPLTMTLLGLGGLGVLARRRRRS